MSDPIFDYQAHENHVELREGLSATLKSQLHEPPEGDREYAYKGEAAFWLQIHQGLLRTSATLPQWCEQFLAEDRLDRLTIMAPRIAQLANQLVHHAHSHHHIEDDHFFPVFLHAFPQLAAPIELLESDHEILSHVLDDIENATRSLHEFSGAASSLAAFEQQSGFKTKTESLHKATLRLDKLFNRHISDEEEICLPTLMRM